MLSRSAINIVLSRLRERYAETTTALHFDSPFQLLISTMLAAQSTDKRVNIVTRDLFRHYPDAETMGRLTPQQLEELIKTVGLYRSKAKNIIATCHILTDKFGGQVPATREELTGLPGVGRKTANVVLSIASKIDAIAVDTHVFRVSNRIGLADATNVFRTEEHLMRNIPQSEWSDAHHWLIWHGRRVCQARKPKCEICFLTDHCKYYRRIFR